MLVPSKYFIKTTNSFENKYNKCSAGLQHRASPVVSFSKIFFLNTRSTNICSSFFLTAMCRARIYSLCFFKKSDSLYVFPAHLLLLLVINGKPRETAVDIVLDVSKNSHGNVYSEVLSEVVARQHGVY